MNVADLDSLKSRLDARRPLDPIIVRSLRDDLIVRWTYHSNAIEGNSLTLRETKVVLEGVTVGGRRLTDHLEAVNHRDAILFVEELVQKRELLNEWQIKSLHQLILRGIDDAHAGVYRTVNGRIARLLMNLELLKAGWPPVILPVESRLAYYEALDAHHVHGDFAPFMEIMIRLVKDSFRPYWFALGEDESTGG